jgi:acetone carboxylase gamma subunit
MSSSLFRAVTGHDSSNFPDRLLFVLAAKKYQLQDHGTKIAACDCGFFAAMLNPLKQSPSVRGKGENLGVEGEGASI